MRDRVKLQNGKNLDFDINALIHRTYYENSGICDHCGTMQESGIEPDAEGYHCEACGHNEVYGLEQWLIVRVL